MLVVQWGLYLLCTGVEQVPQVWNTGVKVTAANRERVYRILKYMLETLKLIIQIIFSFLFVYITSCQAVTGVVAAGDDDTCIWRYGVLADSSLAMQIGTGHCSFGYRVKCDWVQGK